MQIKISIVACACLLICGLASGAENPNGKVSAANKFEQSRSENLGTIEVNSIGDNISESGIDEGILNKQVATGPLAGKRVLDTPYQINTITKEVLDNQGVQAFDEAVKYFPSAQLQYRGGGEMGRPQTRGFQGSVVGNVLWDGFYAVSTTAIPMMMFESLQIQNGLAGSLYGGQSPAGIFSYSRKRPVKDYRSIRGDYISDGNLGGGFDIGDKSDYVGYRGTFFYTHGEREPKNSNTQRKLMALALDFYPTDDLTIETNYSYYNHVMTGFYSSANVRSVKGRAVAEVPSVSSVTRVAPGSERFMRTRTASAKFKYTPIDSLYLEGGYQWQQAIRSRDGTSRFNVPSAFLKALADFDTGSVHHNFGISVNGYRWSSGKNNSLLTDMRNISVADDIIFNDNWNLILSASNTWFKKSNYKEDGISWAGSLVYHFTPDFNVYFTYADSLQDGNSKFYDPADYLPTHPYYGQTISFAPYRSKQYELGTKARIGELDLSAAIFQITRPTYYEVDLIYGEQGEQRNRGAEFTAGGKLLDALSVYGGVTFLDAKMHKSANSAVEGKTMIGEPKIQANLLFDFVVPQTNKLAFTTNLHYTGKRYVDELNTKSVDDYVTVDVGSRYTARNLIGKEASFRFNVNNLFDKKYWAGMFPGSLDGEMKNSGTNLFRGYGRTFMLSTEIKF